MLNDATKMNSEEGADGSVSYILDLEDFIFIINQVNQKDNQFGLGTGERESFSFQMNVIQVFSSIPTFLTNTK